MPPELYQDRRLIHIFMVSLFDRFLSDEVAIAEFHSHFLSFIVNSRIHVRVYTDDPMYLTLLYVDDWPVLKESLVEDVQGYMEQIVADAPFQDFLLEYASSRDLESGR
jgi:hypothetical protein